MEAGLFVSTTSGLSDVKRGAMKTNSQEKTKEHESHISLFYRGGIKLANSTSCYMEMVL